MSLDWTGTTGAPTFHIRYMNQAVYFSVSNLVSDAVLTRREKCIVLKELPPDGSSFGALLTSSLALDSIQV